MKQNSLLKSLLTFLALTACLAFAPLSMMAQTYLSHSQDFDTDNPTGWVIPSTMTITNGVLQGTGTAALPTFGWTLSGARFGLIIKAGSGATNLEIGYLANPDDLGSFTTFTTLPNIPAMNLSHWRCFEFPAPGGDGGRLALRCNGTWQIDRVIVYHPYDVPYSAPTVGFSLDGYNPPSAWLATNYHVYANMIGGEYYWYLTSGTALLPQFSTALSSLQVDIAIKPNTSEAQNIKIGYYTNPNDTTSFVAVKTYNASSSWSSYQPKRIFFSGAPSNARLAIRCNGAWQFDNLSVKAIQSVYDVPYSVTTSSTSLPDGWIAENYYNSYLTTGCAVLPQFNAALNTLQMDLDIKPRNSNAQSIQIGYVTNPSNTSTFVAVQTIPNASGWSDYAIERGSFNVNGLTSGARMAIRCYGDWCISNVQVNSIPSPFDVPYSIPGVSFISHAQPSGWVANNYHAYSNIYYSSNYHYFTSGTAMLPQFNDAVSTLQMDIRIEPRDDAQSIQIGYITNPNNAAQDWNFVSVKSYSSWGSGYQPKRIFFSGAPSGARMAIVCNGGWNVDQLTVSSIQSVYDVPYSVATGSNSLPDGWIAENYFCSGSSAYLTNGCAVLPQFNAALNTLQMDLDIKPRNSNAQSIQIGYVTNPNNPSTFVAVQTIPNASGWSDYAIERGSFNVNGLPSGARMAIRCYGDWCISNVQVNSIPSPFDVPYSIPGVSFISHAQPSGWVANNYHAYSNIYYSSNYHYFTSGTAVLPQFNDAVSTLQMDIRIAPRDDAQSIQIGYITNPNNAAQDWNFVSVKSYSSWGNGFQPKRIFFSGAPSGARMAIVCNGGWNVDQLTVSSIQSVYDVPYSVTLGSSSLPNGWIAENYYYADSEPYLTTGCAVLPQFNAALNTLQMDINIKPKSSNAQSIQIGYVTNPSNPSTFVAVQTIPNASGWIYYAMERGSFDVSGLPSGARMAIRCYGDWCISNVQVNSIPSPIDVPYTLMALDFLSTSAQPSGWLANNYHARSDIWNAYRYLSSGCAMLPRFNPAISMLQLDLDLVPFDNEAQNISIGYVTNNNPSSFVALQTYHYSSSWSSSQSKSVSFFGAPSNARIAIQCNGNWRFDNLSVTMPAVTVPYTQDFQSLEVGSLPAGWYAPNMSVQNGGTTYYRLQGTDYAVLPYFEDANHNPVELHALQLEFRCRPSIMNYGGQIRVGYIPVNGSLTNFVGITTLDFQTYWTDYQRMYVSFGSVPFGARLAIQCIPFGTGNEWLIDDVNVYSAETVPYTEPFAANSAPQGWTTYTGQVQESGNLYTATLTPSTNAWHFGEANGVFDSHTYAKIGATSNDYKWLISPPIVLGDANGVNLSFDIAMSRESGNQVPLTTGEQENQRIFVLVTNDGGATWNEEMGWCGQMCGLPDLNALNPDGNTYNHLLNNYQGQTIQVAFYAECTDNTDNCNHVHIDNVSIQSYDMTMPPTSVTVSEIAGHSAKISWTPALPVQYHWDLWLPYYDNPNYNNNCTPEYMLENGYYYQHLDGYLSHIVTGLEPNESYRAWVRYNDGTTTSDWVASDVFDTESMCAVPTNLQVEVTQHTALVTWDPGQSNQTSWYTYGGTDDMDGETVYEPFRLLTGLEPGEEYEISVTGYCEDGDGDSETISTTFTTLSLPTLTMNDGHSQDNFIVPITPYSLPDSESETQFIIPASQLIDMQYSDIRQISFYEGWYRNCAPWGADVWFAVRIMVVPEANYNNAQYPEDQFYGYNNNPDFETLYHGRLSLDNEGKMNISFGDHPFHYENGNLLIGVKQDTDDVGTDYQADWLGVQTQDWSSMYVPAGSDPTTAKFLPKVTFTYEPDDYLPPTDFEAYVTGAYEVTFSWTPRAGQTATEIMVCGSPDFVGNQFLTNSTDDHCTVVSPNFFEPEETYYYRYHGVYNVDGENHYSAWSAVGSFTMPDACEPPANVQVTQVTPFSAQLSWNGSGEYEYVEYRELNTQWEEGFEGGALPSGWASIANGTGTAAGQWAVYQSISQTSPHTGSYLIRSVGILNPNVRTDNWLILPQITLGGALKFWACTAMGEQQSFSVYVSTTGTTVADFGTEPIQTCSTTSSYQEFTIDLSGYEGLGYVAIRYQFDGVTGSTSVALAIDDVSYHYGGTWTSAGSTESGQIDLYDLTPGATYQARVSALCSSGYSSEYTAPVSFTTPNNIVFADANVKAICVDPNTGWDTNGDGELSYAEAAAVTDIETLFQNNSTIISFNELQYFTGLTSIASNAFAGCSSLTVVTLPNTISSIGQNAFGINSQGVGCESLSSIVLPNSLTNIEFEAFYQSGLTEVNLPFSVTYIGPLAFGDCNNLVAVSLPATVTQIEGNAFTGTSIANIEVDPGNPVYDSRNGCNAIIQTATNELITGCKNTVVPDGVTTIGISAFENCTGLTNITLPATLETIQGWAFLNCHGLTTIEVQAATPPTMEEYAFMNLNLADITVYVPCGSLETYEDSDWSGFNLEENCNIVFEDLMTKQLCVNEWDLNHDGELSYREAAAVTELDNLFSSEPISRFNELQYFTGLTQLSSSEFADCFNLVAVTFPPTVTSIGNYAFDNCSRLASLTLGEHITNIGEYAFSDCGNLTFIKVDATEPPVLDDYAFIGVNVDIPVYVPCSKKNDYQSASGWNDFDNIIDMCDNIVFADDAVKAICVANWDLNNDGELSYAEAAAVTDLGQVFRLNGDIQTFDELQYFTGLTEIGEEAFYGSHWLHAVTLPATVTSVGSLAFFNTNLSSVTLPVSVQTIGVQAYGKCHDLTSVSIPFAVTNMGLNPFLGCENLISITVDDDNPIYTDGGGNAIIKKPVSSPGPIYTLITGCQNTVIPYNENDIMYIGSYAFSWQTHLTSITLPGNVVELGDGAFEHCTSLTEIHVEATTPPTLGDYVFDGLNLYNVWLYVPCGTRDAYDDVEEGWGMFPYIIDPCANIYFYDSNVKAICVDNWDTNGDNEISYDEAAAVTGLGEIFRNNATITSFNELQYFTNVTSIDAYAFNGCRALTSITLPPAITSIGNYAFVSCQALTSLALPSTLTSIGSAVFGNCYALTTIEFPNGLSSIGSSAFMNSGLTSVTIPASVTDIGTNPFRSCSALESITVDPENPKYDSRDGCNAIIYTYTLGSNTRTILISGCKNTVIPDGVTIIDPYAFGGITELTSITLPASITSIGNYAFLNCTGLQSINVKANTPPYLGTTPFNQVDTGIPVYVPCHSIEDYQGASGWSYFTNIQARTDVICFEDDAVKAICVDHWDSDGDGEVSYAEVAYVHTLSNYFSSNTTITSFNELQYFVRLYNLNAWAFNGCSALESVTLPEGVENIYSYAFNGCTSLESITIPETTTQIWERAFFGCTSLESITIPNAVTTIGDHAFYGCIGLTDITIGERVSSMDQYVFGACANLQSITVMADIPPTLEYGVFYQVLTGIPVYVPCGSEELYQAADGWNEFTNYVPMPMDGFICFADPAVKDVCIANWDTDDDGKLSYVEAYMVDYETFGTVFQNNTDITTFDELQYFTGLTRIPNYAFDGCSSLTSVVLPSSLDWIGNYAFRNCSLAGSLVLPESITHIGWEAFKNCGSLTGELVLPPNLTFLGHSTFQNCTGLSGTLEFPTTLTEIQVHAFNGCSGFTNLVLHAGIDDIQGNAFANCTGLASITVLATTPPGSTVASAPFFGDDYDIPVYIPCGTKAAYQAHPSWHNFTNFQYLNCPELASVFYFVEGWNWWAPVVEVTLEGDEGLAATLEGDATLINSQDGGFLRYDNGEWSGTLSHIFRPGQMYKIYIESVSDEYEVTGIEVPEVTLTIVQGYNWFGYVGADASVGEVFGSDFQPAVGDKIVNEAGNSATFDGTQWVGNLTNLYYGTAYIYYSNSSTPKTVVMTE